MADVTGRDVASGTERAQLILVVGLALAVTLVALALLLNTAIYSENFASRQSQAPVDGAAGTGEHIERGLAETLGYVNEHNAGTMSYAELRSNFSDAATNWTRLRNRQLSLVGGTVNVSVVSTAAGTRILQTNASRNFTAGGSLAGQPEWVVATDVWNSPRFEMNVSRKDLYSATFDTGSAVLADSAFHVYFRDASGDEWRVYVFEGAATNSVYVLTERPGEDFQGTIQGYDDFVLDACSTRADHAVIEFQRGTVDGRTCDELDFVSELDAPYDVHYHNASQTPGGDSVDRARGTYDVIVDQATVDPAPYYSAISDQSPYTLSALSNATVEYTYRSGGITVRDARVVEPDTFGAYARESRPVLENATVVDESYLGGTSVAFDVNWEVADRDGDLSMVQVTLTDENGAVITRENTTVSGDSASGNTLLDSLDLTAVTDSDDLYGIEVDVVDSENNSATAPYAKTHEADGDDTSTGDDPP